MSKQLSTHACLIIRITLHALACNVDLMIDDVNIRDKKYSNKLFRKLCQIHTTIPAKTKWMSEFDIIN